VECICSQDIQKGNKHTDPYCPCYIEQKIDEQLVILLRKLIGQVQREQAELRYNGSVKPPKEDIFNYYIPEIRKIFK